MKTTHVARTAGSALLLGLALAGTATAGGRNPASLLLYPEFDNRAGDVTVLTVTNVDTADVLVEFKYIGVRGIEGVPLDCAEFNRQATLTGNDTLTLITNFHNPNQEQGFVYVFARNEAGEPVVRNVLIGNQLVVNGIQAFDYSLNPVAFSGMGPSNGNGLLDLDGQEFEGAPDELYVPRFFGQNHPQQPSPFNSELILISLSGGQQFDTTVDFLVYNDNEDQFSTEYTFHCWDKVPLNQISNVFTSWFLLNFTNQDPAEVIGAPPAIEAGWFRFEGALASSTTTTIQNPSVYGVLVERASGIGVSDLPWESVAQRTNGKLFPRSLDGQN